jgi:hypothetical protein
MKTNRDQPLNDLLARWHRWVHAATRLDDSLLRDFDAMVARVPPRLRAALVLQARNLHCGAQVWSSPRVEQATTAKARQALLVLLEPDAARWFGKRIVQLNERGNRIGESNPRAEASDHDVDLCVQLRAEGYTLGWLAAKFEVGKSTVQDWCSGRRRGQVPVRRKEVMG